MKKRPSAITTRLVAIVLGMLGVSSVAYAECAATGCFGIYIEELYPVASGGAWIKTSGNETLTSCTADSGVYLRLDPTAGFKEIYATLLAAQLSEKKVNIRIVEGSNPCQVAYVTLNRNNW